MIQKQRYPRALYRCTVSLWTSEGPVRVNCFTKNVSTGGLCIVMQDQLDVSQQVRLQIHIEDSLPPVVCEAVVRWTLAYRMNVPPSPSTRYETGFEFCEISPTDRARIEKVVSEN